MYYIYHIPGIKIGCSKNPKRRVKTQGYTEFTILETHTDIQIASEREIELQKEYGYKVDCTLYKQTTSSPTLEGIIKGGQNGALKKWQLENPELYKEKQKESASLGGRKQGPIQGKKNVESGHISNLGIEQAKKIYTCEYCKKTGKSSSMFRWHFENCKQKPIN